MITIDPRARQEVLSCSSMITTDSADAVAVIINAGVLLAWLEDASCTADARIRLRALSQQATSLIGTPRENRPLDDPAEFLRRAKLLYAFATAGGVTS